MGEAADAELARLDPEDLWKQAGSRLRSLPVDAYLRCLAYFAAEYRRLLRQDDLTDGYDDLLDRIVALAAQAAAGADVAEAARRLDRAFTALTYPGVDEDDLADAGMYDGPLDMAMFTACGEVLWELTDAAHRYDSASRIVGVALDYEDHRDRLASTRLLLKFLDRAEREAGAERSFAAEVAVPGPLTVRRAGPADLRVVLDVLDSTAAWLLHARDVPEWLSWPDRRDALGAAIDRGQVWLLGTAGGDVVGTISLSTDDPGAGLWADDDRRVAATYVSRLAVRPHRHGQGIGAELLDWARGYAYRHGSFWLRIAAWPGLPGLHAYLRRQHLREFWTVSGPPAVARTLFAGHAAPANPAGRVAERSDPVLPTHRVDLAAADPRPAEGPGPDHAHRTDRLLSEHGAPVRLVPGYRYRLRHTGDGWRLQVARYVGWSPGDLVVPGGGLAPHPERDHVLTHPATAFCDFEIATVRRAPA